MFFNLEFSLIFSYNNMNLSNQLLFLFSALGAFNSSVLSVYFICFNKTKKVYNYFLGALMAVLSIRIWKSIFFYFNPDLSKYYLQIGLSACFFIGPLLYLYIKSKCANLNKRSYLHLLILGLISCVVGYLYPYNDYPELWGNIFYKVINYQWLVYILCSSFLLKDALIKTFSKNKKLTYDEVWLTSVFLGVVLIWLSYFMASYTSYIMGALSFSFAFYLSVLLIYYKKTDRLVTVPKKEKYAGNKIEPEKAIQLLFQIKDVVQQKELYKNPDLTLNQLAKEINIRPHTLSQLLNDNINKSFSLFINEYRINEALQILDSKQNLKMEIIAELSGFNSKSTFYTAFKKITNTTPAKYAE